MIKLNKMAVVAALVMSGAQVMGMHLERTHVRDDLIAVLDRAVDNHHHWNSNGGTYEDDVAAGKAVTLSLEFNLFYMDVSTTRWLMHVINAGYPIERVLLDIKRAKSGPLVTVNLEMNDFAREYIKMVCEYDGQYGPQWSVEEIPAFVRSIALLLEHPSVSVDGKCKEEMIIGQRCCRQPLQKALGELWEKHGIVDAE